MAGGASKYEREIAEILERMERDEPRTERVKRQARHNVGQRWQEWRGRASRLRGVGQGGGHAAAWTWIGLTIGVGLLGLVLKAILPVLGLACGIAMVLIFFSPLLRRFGGASEMKPSNTWRGQIVDLPPRGGILDTLGYHWRRFRRRF